MTVEHGTARAHREGCRCGPCRYAYSATRRRRRPYGDPAVVQAHVRMLSRAGIGYRRLAELSGVSAKTLCEVVYRNRRPMASTVDKVLAVQSSAPPAEKGEPILGASRRLRALRTNGWSNLQLARRLGMSETAASAVVMERRLWVMRPTAAAIRDLYADLSEQQAPMSASEGRNRTYARQRLWFPPIAWDIETIDDPAVLPCLLPPVTPVDRELELLVQHLAAGHPVPTTMAAIAEIGRRMPGAKPREIAAVAQCTARQVTDLLRRRAAA